MLPASSVALATTPAVGHCSARRPPSLPVNASSVASKATAPPLAGSITGGAARGALTGNA